VDIGNAIMPRSSRLSCIVAVIAACLAFACLALLGAAHANDRAMRQLEEWKAEVTQTEERLIRPDLTDDDIEAIRIRLEQIKTQGLALVEELRPALADLRRRLDQLGQAPEDGIEDEAVREQRDLIAGRVNQLEGVIRQLEVNALVAGQLSGRAADMQRTRFVQRVFETSHSILSPTLWKDGARNLSSLWERFSFLLGSWFDTLVANISTGGLVAIAAALVSAGLIVGPLRLRLHRLLGPKLQQELPSDLERLWRAVSRVLLDVATTVLALIVVYTTAREVDGALTPRMTEVLAIVFDAAMWFVIVSSATTAVLAPRMRFWRLPPLSDSVAAILAGLGTMTAFVYAVHVLWSQLASMLFLPVDITVAQGAVIATAMSALLFTALWQTGREGAHDVELRAPQGRAQFLWLRNGRGVAWVLGAVIVAALTSGYIALASFLAVQIVVTGLLVLAIYMLHHLTDEVFATGLMRGWILGNFLRDTLGLSERGVERLSLLVSMLFDVMLLFIGLPIIVLQWAVTWVDLKSWLSAAFFGFRIGEATISLSTVLIAIGLLVFGVIATRLAVRWLDQRFLSRTRLDRGVRNSIRTASGYAGFIVAGVLAVGYAGLDFTNVAIVAGALSVGIGFGLQSIINNFVSGLILLAERPIRVGDWISVAGEDGYVTRINVRSTEIETFDRSTVIVPNSDMISGSVKNWTANQTGRVTVAVGVSYDADPQSVRDVLLSCAADHPEIRLHPEPYVVFKDFGSSSLDFELRCFINDVENILTVSSDLRFRIHQAFVDAAIEIPFPQHDIHIKDVERIGAALAGRSNTKGAKT
jgi:small-conductance mechanosensitive channel